MMMFIRLRMQTVSLRSCMYYLWSGLDGPRPSLAVHQWAQIQSTRLERRPNAEPLTEASFVSAGMARFAAQSVWIATGLF